MAQYLVFFPKFFSEKITILLIWANTDLDFKIFCITLGFNFLTCGYSYNLSWLPEQRQLSLHCNITSRQHLVLSGCWSLLTFSPARLQN